MAGGEKVLDNMLSHVMNFGAAVGAVDNHSENMVD
jgi:hypothetical protein